MTHFPLTQSVEHVHESCVKVIGGTLTYNFVIIIFLATIGVCCKLLLNKLFLTGKKCVIFYKCH